MADKKISQLVDGGVPQATDEFVVDRAGADNFKLDWASLKTAAETDAVLDGDPAGGDLSGTYPDPDLAAIGVAIGPVGDGTNVAVVTIDTKGRVTGLTSTPITGAPPSGAAGGVLAGTYPNPDLAAAVAGAGLALGLNILSVNVDGTTIEINADALQLKDTGPGVTGPIGSATTVPVVTINAKGQVTALGSATITGVTPGGAAGGVLAGTYPDPGFAVDMATQAELDAAIATTVLKSLYDANTVLAADTDNTPAALTMGASTILARLAAGNIKAATPSEIRTLLALVVGTNVEAWDADLDAIAALAPSNDDIIQRKAGAWTNRTVAQYLVDLAAAGTTFQPLDATLTALAAANWAANALPIGTGADTLSQTAFAANTFPARASTGNLVATPITDAALTVLDDTTVAAMRTTLGIPTAVGGTEWTVITKGSDESVASSTTVQADDALLFTTVNGAIYEVELVIIYASPAGAGTPDLKFNFCEGATSCGSATLIGYSGADAALSFAYLMNNGVSLTLGTAAADRMALNICAVNGLGGSLTFNWAQGSSSLNATIVRAGSVLRYRRLK